MELFRLLGTIAIENDAANKALKTTVNTGNSAQASLSNAFTKIGGAAVRCGQIISSGLAVGATAIAALTGKALGNYAEYEQLVGGVDTLFKSSSQKVQQYAADAYKTAGMSANEYMSTVTGFSSSLLQSLAGSTSEAGGQAVAATKEALQEQYDAVADANEKQESLMEEAHAREIEAFEEATEQKIELINRQYKESLKNIDEEKYRKLKAIDEQIEALNEQTEKEREAIQKREQEQKKASLQEKIDAAETPEAKAEAEQELADYLADLAQKEREKKRKEQIEELREKKEAINEEATAKKEAVREQYEEELATVKKQREEQLKVIQKAQEKELESLKETNEAKLEEMEKAMEKQAGAAAESSTAAAVYTADIYDQAAEIADRAVVDMADNANKMGTSIDLIQNAYQGFAKQNYTMLDNLKLGYGGTQEEMKRLIRDASNMKDIQEELGITVDESSMSFANIVNAIHIMQHSLGIAGATAAEAEDTISGSVASMKAAFSNLLTGFGNKNADLSLLVNQFTESFVIAANNVIPRISIILNGIASAVVQFAPILLDTIVPMILSLLPALIDGAVALVDGLVKALPSIISSLVSALPALVGGFVQIADSIIAVLPQITDAICAALPDLLPALIVGLVDLTVALAAALPEICIALVESMPAIAESIMVGFSDAMKKYGLEGVTNVFANMGAKINEVYTTYIQPVVDGFKKILIELFNENQDKIGKIGEWWAAIFGEIQERFQRMYESIVPLIEFLSNFITEHMETIKAVIQAGIDYLIALIDFFVALVTGDWEGMWTAICTLAETWIEFLVNIFTLWIEYIGSILNALYTKVTQVFTNIKTKITTIVTTIRTWVQNAFTQMRDALALIWDAIAKKISDVWNGIWETMKGIMNNIIGGIESMVNRCIDAINELIEGINALVGSVPGISEIPLLPSFKLPRLEKGGILEKGEIGLLEGNGAEAVVPLDQNQKWISAVAADMEVAMGGKGTAEKMQVLINIMSDIRDNLPEALVEAMKTIRLDVDNREFARLVKAVN